MQIHFVLFNPGYWECFVTTNDQLAQQKLAENPSYRLKSTEIKPVDFEPNSITCANSSKSYSLLRHQIDLSEYSFFAPVYEANPDTNWVQAIRTKHLPHLEEHGKTFQNPEMDFWFGDVATHLSLPTKD